MDILKKNQDEKNSKIKKKKSITQGKNSRSRQFFAKKKYISLTNAKVLQRQRYKTMCFAIKNSLKFVKKSRKKLKTQGENSRFWRIHLVELPKTGPISKPDLIAIGHLNKTPFLRPVYIFFRHLKARVCGQPPTLALRRWFRISRSSRTRSKLPRMSRNLLSAEKSSR